MEEFNVYSDSLASMMQHAESLLAQGNLDTDPEAFDAYQTLTRTIEAAHLIFSCPDSAPFDVTYYEYNNTLSAGNSQRRLRVFGLTDESPGGEQVGVELEVLSSKEPFLGTLYSDGTQITITEVKLSERCFEEFVTMLRDKTSVVRISLATECFVPKEQEFLTRVTEFGYSEGVELNNILTSNFLSLN